MIPVGIIRTFFKTRAFEYKSEKSRDLSLLGALVKKLPLLPLGCKLSLCVLQLCGYD